MARQKLSRVATVSLVVFLALASAPLVWQVACPARAAAPGAAPRPADRAGARRTPGGAAARSPVVALPAAKPAPAAKLPTVLDAAAAARELARLQARARVLHQLKTDQEREAFFADLGRFLAQVDRNADEAVAGYQMLAQAYGEIGERELELQAFGDYLKLVARHQGGEAAARLAVQQADRRFHREHDYLNGLGYYDLILTQYPQSAQVPYAMFMVGAYYQRLREPQRATDEFRKVVEAYPHTAWGHKARSEIATLQYNLGLHEAAISELRQLAADCPERVEAGAARMTIAMMYYGQGLTGYPPALAEFQAIIRDYPDLPAAKSAKGMVDLINRKLAGAVVNDLPR